MLEIFNNDELIFSSESKWLHPIFEFEEALQKDDNKYENLSAHDSVIGKAAAVLLTRLGVNQLHGDLVSNLAIEYISQKLGFSHITWNESVEKIQCMTETELENLTNDEDMYNLVKARHDKACIQKNQQEQSKKLQ